ncbi:hypothetical protein CN918_27215 [Priestia megaterium]|nr:hypothetical protein CN918_27215 [Priestia megaterium]
MITLKISPTPTTLELEHIRQLIGFYRGVASFSGTEIINIHPKEDFHLEGLLQSLRSMKYNVKIMEK